MGERRLRGRLNPALELGEDGTSGEEGWRPPGAEKEDQRGRIRRIRTSQVCLLKADRRPKSNQGAMVKTAPICGLYCGSVWLRRKMSSCDLEEDWLRR